MPDTRLAIIPIGENIHCTRVHKRGGKYAIAREDGSGVIAYDAAGERRFLPIPRAFIDCADWENGKVRHCAVAIWQGLNGAEAERAAGADYIASLARAQEAAEAQYLDVNVDEFSTDDAEKAAAMTWAVAVVQRASTLPVSVDSSNTAILRAGLEACDRGRAKPMVNSVSLERAAAIPLAAEFGAVVIASAAGESGLPSTTEGRLANLAALMPMLKEAGFEADSIHVDPLVFPIATDSANGKALLEAVTAVRETYGATLHVGGGLSNVSFGMPNRKLINQVFAYLAVEAGADSGIVDPLQVNSQRLRELDTGSESFALAKALLLGEDEFGMNFIMASREGRI
ncbi:MAG: dihydropteroate synthase [Kiritimatiellae bacterium]|nr:dihydropteroate synthase [Kiritimatiellia bacterium]